MKLLEICVIGTLLFILSGCTSIQDEYKPLYQVEPEKKKFEETLP